MKAYFVYILTNKENNVLYTGVTSELKIRAAQHKEKVFESFTQRYNVNNLVYYEAFPTPEAAISREKQIKAGRRAKKLLLIQNFNPYFLDLYSKI